MEMQQRSTRGGPHIRRCRRVTSKYLRLHVERIQVATQARAERDGAGVGSAVGEVIGQ
ncbi:hypothetical protein D3C86_1855890 [compost metagenome]